MLNDKNHLNLRPYLFCKYCQLPDEMWQGIKFRSALQSINTEQKKYWSFSMVKKQAQNLCIDTSFEQ